jgi:[ribosomal protein S18]-alanine N-acetyltransferase
VLSRQGVSSLRIAAVTPASAREFASWRYPPPYSVYDAELGDWERYVDPAWNYRAVEDENGQLVGNCCFGEDARVPGGRYDDQAVDVGGGMRPELTGQGRGRAFLAALFGEAERLFPGRPLRVTVAGFNRRALRAVRAAGFVEVERFRNPSGDEFAILVRQT